MASKEESEMMENLMALKSGDDDDDYDSLPVVDKFIFNA